MTQINRPLGLLLTALAMGLSQSATRAQPPDWRDCNYPIEETELVLNDRGCLDEALAAPPAEVAVVPDEEVPEVPPGDDDDDNDDGNGDDDDAGGIILGTDNGVGNGVDGPPPGIGNDLNDGPGTQPGEPGGEVTAPGQID